MPGRSRNTIPLQDLTPDDAWQTEEARNFAARTARSLRLDIGQTRGILEGLYGPAAHYTNVGGTPVSRFGETVVGRNQMTIGEATFQEVQAAAVSQYGKPFMVNQPRQEAPDQPNWVPSVGGWEWTHGTSQMRAMYRELPPDIAHLQSQRFGYGEEYGPDVTRLGALITPTMRLGRLPGISVEGDEIFFGTGLSKAVTRQKKAIGEQTTGWFSNIPRQQAALDIRTTQAIPTLMMIGGSVMPEGQSAIDLSQTGPVLTDKYINIPVPSSMEREGFTPSFQIGQSFERGMQDIAPGISAQMKQGGTFTSWGFDKNNLVVQYRGESSDPFGMKGLGSKTVAVTDPTMPDWNVQFGGQSIKPAHITQMNEAALAMGAITSTWSPQQFEDVLGYNPTELGQKEVRGLWKGLSEQGRIAEYSFTQQAFLGEVGGAAPPQLAALMKENLAHIVPGTETTEEGMRRGQVTYKGFGYYGDLGEQPRGIFEFGSRYVSPETLSDIGMFDEDRQAAIRHYSTGSRATAASILGASAAMHGQAPHYKTVSGSDILDDWSSIQAEAEARAKTATPFQLKEDANVYGTEAQTMSVLGEYTGSSGIRVDMSRFGMEGSLVIPNPQDVMKRFGRNDVEGRVTGLPRMIPELFGKMAQHEITQDPGSFQALSGAVEEYKAELEAQTSSSGIRQAAVGGRAPGFGGKIQALAGLAPAQMWIPERRLTGMLGEIWNKEDFGGDVYRQQGYKTPAQAARAMLMGETEMIPDVYGMRYPTASPEHAQMRLRPATFEQLQSVLGKDITYEQAQTVPASVSSLFSPAQVGDYDDDPVEIRAGLASQSGATLSQLNKMVTRQALRSNEIESTRLKIESAPKTAEEAYLHAAGMLQSTSMAKFGEESFAVEERMGRIGPLFQAFRRAIPMGIEAQAAGTSQEGRARHLAERSIAQVAGPLYGLSVDARTLPKAADELARHLSSYNVKTRGFARGEGPGFVRDLLSSEVGLFRELGEDIPMSGDVFAGMFMSSADKNFGDVAAAYEGGAPTSDLVRGIGGGRTQREVISTAPWLTAVVASGYAKAAGKDPEWAANLDEWGTGMVEKGSAARTYRSLLSRGRGKQTLNAGEFARVTGTMIEGGMLSPLRAETDTEVLSSMGVLPTDESNEYPGLLQATSFAQRSRRESAVDRLMSAMSQEEKATMIGPQLQQAVSGDRFEEVRKRVLADYPYDPSDPQSEKAAFGRMVQASHENVVGTESNWRQRPLRAAHTGAVQAGDMETARNVHAYAQSMGMALGDQGQFRYAGYINEQKAAGTSGASSGPWAARDAALAAGGGGAGAPPPSGRKAVASPMPEERPEQNPSATAQASIRMRAEELLGSMKRFAGGESVPMSQTTTVGGETTSFTRMVKARISQPNLESVNILGGDQENLAIMKGAYQSALAGETPGTKAEVQAAGKLGSYLTAVKRVASDVSGPRGLERGYRESANQLMKEMEASGMNTTQFREEFGNLAQATRSTDLSYASARLDEAGTAIGMGDTSNWAVQEAQGVARNYRERGKAAGASAVAMPRSMTDVESELTDVTKELINNRRDLVTATLGATEAEKKLIEIAIDKSATSSISSLRREAFQIGGVSGLSGFLGSSAYQTAMGELGGGGGGGRGAGGGGTGEPSGRGWLDVAGDIKSMIRPFSAEGAMIKMAWRGMVGNVGQQQQAYAQNYMGSVGLAGQTGGDVGGAFSGVGGNIVLNTQQKQQNAMERGEAFQRAWGWTQDLVGPAISQSTGVFGVPAALGATTAIAAGKGLFGATIAGGAAGVGAAVAGIAIPPAGALYGLSISENTAENQYEVLEDRRNRQGDPLEQLWFGTVKPKLRTVGSFMRGDWDIGDPVPTMGLDARQKFNAPFASQSMPDRVAGVDYLTKLFMEDENLAGYGPEAIRSAIGQEFAFGDIDALSDIDAKDIENLLGKGGDYGKFSGLAGSMSMGPGGAREITQWLGQQGSAFDTNEALGALQQYAPLTSMGMTGQAAMRMAERGQMAGQELIDYNKFIGGDTRYIDRQVRSQTPSTFSARTGVTLSGQRQLLTADPYGLPLGTTSGFSDIFAGLDQQQFDLVGAGSAVGGLLSGTAALGGMMDDATASGAIKGAYGDVGFVQDWDGQSLWSLESEYKSSRRGLAAQSRGIGWSNLAHRYGTGAWNTVEDLGGTYQQQRQLKIAGTALSHAQQVGGIYTNQAGEDISFTGSFAFQEQALGMQYGNAQAGIGLARDQAAENRGWQLQTRGYERADMATGKERGLIQRGWDQQDMSVNYGRGTTQYGWQQEDFQRSVTGFGLQMQGVAMQRGYQQEDFATARATSELQFGWQMEDADENIRFASGRTRKKMITQRERAVTMQNISDEGMDTQEERADELMSLEDERFELQKEGMDAQQARMEKQESWRKADYDTQIERFEATTEWQDEDWDTQEERFEAKTKHEDALYELQQRGFDQQEASLNANHALQIQQLIEAQEGYKQQKILADEADRVQDSIDLKQAQSQKAQLGVAQAIADTDQAWDEIGSIIKRAGDIKADGTLNKMERILRIMQSMFIHWN